MTLEEVQAETELRLRDIGQRFGALPQEKDELLHLLSVSAAHRTLCFRSSCRALFLLR
jgi:hypothetical protein